MASLNPRLNLPPLDTELDGTIAKGRLSHFVRTLRDWGRHVDANADVVAAEIAALQLDASAACQVRMAAPQSLVENVSTLLSFDTEDYDVLGWHAAGTSKIIPTLVDRWYRVSATGAFQSGNNYSEILFEVFKNGAALAPPRRAQYSPTAVNIGQAVTVAAGLVQMNGTTDFLEVRARHQNATAAAKTCDASFTVELAR